MTNPYDDWKTEYDEKIRREKEQLEKEQLEEDRRMGVIENLADTKDGRHFLRVIMEETRAFQPNYSMSIEASAFTEGRRSVGLWLLELCKKAGCANVLFENEEEE